MKTIGEDLGRDPVGTGSQGPSTPKEKQVSSDFGSTFFESWCYEKNFALFAAEGAAT